MKCLHNAFDVSGLVVVFQLVKYAGEITMEFSWETGELVWIQHCESIITFDGVLQSAVVFDLLLEVLLERLDGVPESLKGEFSAP